MEDVYSLIERAHSGEKEARDTLVYENTGLVWSVVRRFSYSGADREELFQIGVIGLLKAIDRFDPSFQVCFSPHVFTDNNCWAPFPAAERRQFPSSLC